MIENIVNYNSSISNTFLIATVIQILNWHYEFNEDSCGLRECAETLMDVYT